MKESLTITFNNQNIGEIKGFIDEKGNPWFVASKICNCLKLENSSVVLSRIKEQYNRHGIKLEGVSIRYPLLESSGGRQKTAVVDEKILYEMIFMSRTKKAFDFRQWVLGEVLPSLRKHGEYRMQGKLIRRSLTDTIKAEICDKTENANEKKFAYGNFSKLINKSLGLPQKVNRDNLDSETLEKIAHRENLAQALLQEGKNYREIADILLTK